VCSSLNLVEAALHSSDANDNHERKLGKKRTIRVAHVGNSVQYYGDTPRLLEQMLDRRYSKVVQDSCLRPASTLWSVWKFGNGMQEKFATPEAKQKDGSYDIGAPTVEALLDEEDWDFVVLNDRTQNPTREDSRRKSLEILRDEYVDAFYKDTVAIFLQTAAYKVEEIRGSEDLGGFDEFTERVREGYEEYIKLMESLSVSSKLAPVGDAFAVVREDNEELFDKLYSYDDFHPSLHGTWLQCCVLFCTMVEREPPCYDECWWETARFMVDPPLPLPTEEEAEELRQVAIEVCNL